MAKSNNQRLLELGHMRMGGSGGNGDQRRRPISALNVPIVGQSKPPGKLASITYIQTLVVGACTCGGDVIIRNYTEPGKCSGCGVLVWITAAVFDRNDDPTLFNVQFGFETPPADGADKPTDSGPGHPPSDPDE